MERGMEDGNDQGTRAPSGASSQAAPTTMASVDETRARLTRAVAPLDRVERIALDRARGRIVAEAVHAAYQVPPHDNSSMDGFALRHADLVAPGQGLPITGRVAAGHPAGTLRRGTAVRIFTGALVPEGADTVVKLEDCQVQDERVRLRAVVVRKGDNVRRAGEDIAYGAEVVPAGRRLRPQDLGVAASVGITEVHVRRRPRVGVLVTGDELVSPGTPLGEGQIYDSNSVLLSSLMTALGCEPTHVARTSDSLEATRDALRRAARDVDLVISSGGVSVGQEDHVKAAVRELGELELWKVAVKPGKPLGFGRIGAVPWLGLPGNPVSGFVTFLLFGVPLIRRLQGREPLMPEALPLRAGFTREYGPKREEYVRVRVEEGYLVPYRHQGAGVLSSASWGDGLARIPMGASVRAGDELGYYAYTDLFA